MRIQNIGVLHPGAMGSSIGVAIKAGGREVYWVSKDRSVSTFQRAKDAGFRDLSQLGELVDRCDLIISVCPPVFATEVAKAVCDASFNGLFLDANAVCPDTSRSIAAIMESGAAAFVDGGIIGPPAWERGTTRLYLSGSQAASVAEIFTDSTIDAVVIEGPAGRASALKMTYAAYTKGTTALVGAILAVAEHEGVRDMLQREWSASQPQLADNAVMKVRRTTAKAWRFEGEMREIAQTFKAAGLPDGFHQAAATVYARQSGFKDSGELPSFQDVLDALLDYKSES
ncbi:MAG: NAD(P)-dependent oxidoreductase [Spirochaetaceae bacterium]|nr:MAG: NAD(P)-dependent oxidoreductase [Spirochaetaceae bacterium]